MFVKKLVEMASKKHGGSAINGLRAEDVNPRLVFHHGVPSGSSSLAYDSIHNILAIATRDGRIKLSGENNTQALLQSDDAVPSKFLLFFEHHGILINITIQNHIEVWDVEERNLCSVHNFNEEITSISVIRQSPYMYLGDCHGNITVLKVDPKLQHLIHMQYTIPYKESHGLITGETNDSAVISILPQPMAETKRVLVIFRDGVIVLWGVSESEVVYMTGRDAAISSHRESKEAVSACWACSSGSKVVVGYSNGDIFLWAVPVVADQEKSCSFNKRESHAASNLPLLKLNLGYKLEKAPIVSLRWVVGDGKASRLYVNGFSEVGSFHSFQIIILNENTESRMIKLVLPLTEACLAMEMISCCSDRNKLKQSTLVLLMKSGNLCLFDDSDIERYLLQCQSKSCPSLPTPILVKLPYVDSSITVAKLYTGNPSPSSPTVEDHFQLANKYPCLLSTDTKDKNGNHSSSARLKEISKTRNLYITGHQDGAINFWDASCPFLLPLLSMKPQGEAGNSSTGVQVTALFFDIYSQILVAGDRNGLARIMLFKEEHSATENILSFLQAKQGGNYTTCCIKLDGAIQSISLNSDTKHLAIGTSKGYVFMIDMNGTTILYQKQFSCQAYMGINSLQFEKYNQNIYQKNALVVGMEDSSVLILDEDTGNVLSPGVIHPKKPSKALLMHILDHGDLGKDQPANDPMSNEPLIVVCSEKAVRLYYFSHAIQGIKKLYIKKKLNGSCCYASIVYSSTNVGILLVFASGKMELRSLPDLTFLKETSISSCMFSDLKSISNIVLCASSEGELIVVNSDQEAIFFSVLLQGNVYRHVEHLIQVYSKDRITAQEELSTGMITQKEKKKGIFGAMVKDLLGNKSSQSQQPNDLNFSVGTSEEHFDIFSTDNFPQDDANKHCSVKDEDVELDIDDIDLDDIQEKPKGRNFAGLNTQMLGKKFQAMKGKLKPKKDEKVNQNIEDNEDGKAVGAVDLIKRKYGYSVNNESSVPTVAASKLSENVNKLKAIETKTSEMQASAQSFSSMTKQVLRSVQRDRK
ncbi:LOW QUALITY PROTEIN: uncharacterized protein LOC120271389 [Dioscorea cayenensis subsp. rotundata]|uniref:LOW QUALITY PROTEIN: uncharacterized protein LOC120271389 n=1 Tax=Dioscorea cayennensis subsp. rotundata TaxID=55577 RepID=A0AB40C2S9_DIOCR|nr:LOW QUALITY PROTEIN: uncharacterized protein LOC120271389 [Dioscorea cayenensis subsp. rotundata]